MSNTTDDLIYFAFDAMYADEQDIRNLGLFERKAKLRKLLDDAGGPPSIRYVTHLDMDGKDVIKVACEMKPEGIISKRISAPYVAGRKGAWTKSKCRAGQHAVVGGYVTGPEGFRSLLLGIPKGKRPGAHWPRWDGLSAEAALLAAAEAPPVGDGKIAFLGGDPPKAAAQAPLPEAEACCGNRVHELDR